MNGKVEQCTLCVVCEKYQQLVRVSVLAKHTSKRTESEHCAKITLA